MSYEGLKLFKIKFFEIAIRKLCLEKYFQIVEEQLEAFSKGEIMEQLRQLKQNFDLPKYIIEPLKPLSNFLDMLQDIVSCQFLFLSNK